MATGAASIALASNELVRLPWLLAARSNSEDERQWRLRTPADRLEWLKDAPRSQRPPSW